MDDGAEMKTLTVHLEDHVYDELVSSARERGVTLDDLARDHLGDLTAFDAAVAQGWNSSTPSTLPVVVRHQLALLHRIMARLVDGEGEDSERADQLQRAEVLERGYVVEYADEFHRIEPQLSGSETTFVTGVLDMFERLEAGYVRLSDSERERLGPSVLAHVRFGGFDLSNRRERRLLKYARHLIDGGEWSGLAGYFDPEHDGGSSYVPRYATYTRMLEAFLPIWKDKVQAGDARGYLLDADEIVRITAAALDPSEARVQH